MKMRLKIKQLNAEEVRRGWVRIHENSRKGIPADSEDLIKITYGGKSVRRIVLGATQKSDVDEGYIAMDEPTREKLGIKDYNRNKEYEFGIKEYRGIKKIPGEICYYWNHPEFSLRFSTRIAIILGSLSIIISLIGVIR